MIKLKDYLRNKFMLDQKIKLSVIVPVFNEETIIESVLSGLQKELRQLDVEYEIIAVNDGSSDNSQRIIEKNTAIKLINHPYNKGYGASLKTGARQAQYDWLLLFDGDGQHKAEYIKDFLAYTSDYDIIIGCRNGYKGPWLRQPGKKILHWIANYLAEQKIPDLNCGFRLIKKEPFLKYLPLFP